MGKSFAFDHGFSVSDEILTAIGLTVVCQSHIELQLSLLIHKLTDLEFTKENMDIQKGWALTSGMSFRTLCAALSSLVREILEESDERHSRFTDLMGKLQHFEEFRNQVAHSNWAHGEGFKPERGLRLKTTARQHTGVKHHSEEIDIAQISNEIKIASLTSAKLTILVSDVAGKPISGSKPSDLLWAMKG